MKTLDKSVTVLFVLCLIFCSIVWPAVTIMTQDAFYLNHFEKTGILPDENNIKNINYIGGDYGKTASFTSNQIKELVKHTTDFFENKNASFNLTMDEVIINGEITDNVNIFSDVAVKHMDDVKILYNNIKIIVCIATLILIGCIIYMTIRKSNIKHYLFKRSLGTVIAILGVVLVFLLFVLIKAASRGYTLSMSAFAMELWYYLHYVFFPFNSSKFSGAFFNDTLTQILTIDFFMNTVTFIASILFSVLTIWLIIAKKLSAKNK